MSLNLKQNVKCPKCSQMSEVTVWNSITVKDSEDLKHDLLTGKGEYVPLSVLFVLGTYAYTYALSR